MTKPLQTIYLDAVRDHGTSYGITIIVTRNAAEEWSKKLSMLRYDLVEAVEIVGRDGRFRLILHNFDEPPPRKHNHKIRKHNKWQQDRSLLTWEPHQATIKFCQSDLEYLLHFLLTVYSGVPMSYDHVDIEVNPDIDIEGKVLTLVVKTP